MQTQASTQGQADYQGSNQQQAPTFGLVSPDSSVLDCNQLTSNRLAKFLTCSSVDPAVQGCHHPLCGRLYSLMVRHVVEAQ